MNSCMISSSSGDTSLNNLGGTCSIPPSSSLLQDSSVTAKPINTKIPYLIKSVIRRARYNFPLFLFRPLTKICEDHANRQVPLVHQIL